MISKKCNKTLSFEADIVAEFLLIFRRLLNIDSDRRLTVDELLNSAWLNDVEPNDHIDLHDSGIIRNPVRNVSVVLNIICGKQRIDLDGFLTISYKQSLLNISSSNEILRFVFLNKIMY